MTERPNDRGDSALSKSGFEKKGGYTTPTTSVTALPKVPSGVAPGSATKPAASGSTGQGGSQGGE